MFSEIEINGQKYAVIHVFNPRRVIYALVPGIFLVADQDPQTNAWADTGNPPVGDEMAVLKALVDAQKDSVTVTKD